MLLAAHFQHMLTICLPAWILRRIWSKLQNSETGWIGEEYQPPNHLLQHSKGYLTHLNLTTNQRRLPNPHKAYPSVYAGTGIGIGTAPISLSLNACQDGDLTQKGKPMWMNQRHKKSGVLFNDCNPFSIPLDTYSCCSLHITLAKGQGK